MHKQVTRTTVWKLQDFRITQILREINFVDSRSAKTAVFAILGAVNFVNLVIFSLKNAKNGSFALLESIKLISRKICVTEKS